ncbi:leucine-rich repeat protein [Liberiplasma polymorphum]|uniref:leucine-rich repeat protein n=1 Tax=Liberiplasma polymorphum TaxID=3374570 RepID=UPI003770F837
MKKILAINTLLFVTLLLTGCGLFSKYTIDFETGELNETIESLENLSRNTIVELPTLEKEGYIFVGWESDDVVYQRTLEVSKDLTLTPVFESVTEAFEIIEIDEDYARIVNYNGTAKYLKIPYEINGYIISRIEGFAFEDSNIIEVLIPNSVLSVQSNAFKNAVNLEVVEYYGDYVGTSIRLISSDLYEELLEAHNCIIVDDTFTPSKETPWIFEEGCAIKEVYHITESVIGPDNKEYFSYEALIDHKYYSHMIMQLIHFPAFEGATSLRRVVLPKQLRFFDTLTTTIEEIIIHEDNPYLQSVDNVIYSADLTILYFYPGGLKAKTFEIPEHVTKVNISAFGDGSHLEKVIIPCTLDHISGSAFANASSIKSFEVCDEHTTLKSINGVLFEDTSDLTLIAYPKNKAESHYVVPEGTTVIGEGAFAGVTRLQTIEFPDGLRRISHSAFFGFENIKIIDLPSSVTSVEHSAFFSRTHFLETLIVRRGVDDGKVTFIAESVSNNPNLVVYVPDNSLSAYAKVDLIYYFSGELKPLSELNE